MSSRALRGWGWLHRWSSLACTLFLLILCLTGLPLIFSHEIGELTRPGFQLPPMSSDAPRAPLDAVEAAARAARPGLVPLYFFAEEDEPDLWYVKLDTRTDTDERDAVLLAFDARTGGLLGAPQLGTGFMGVMYRLHVDLFAGLPGKLFLGAMGVLFVLSLVSGVVLYAPFMRRLDFGAVRRDRPARIRWLDLHNLLGIATLAWALVVGGTGVINTWAELILKSWQREQMQQLAAGRATPLLPADGKAIPERERVQRVLERATRAAPHMRLSMLAYPGTLLGTPQHFAVILHGDTPLTARLRQSLLVHPETGEVLQASARPWYVTLFQLSQPLHFGDYGGLPLKILWAVLDLIAIAVLSSGLYLWLAKRGARRAGETLIQSSPRRKPGSSASVLLDSGFRRNDE
jgi:uncharacterized iron-regulated membrane protein